MAVYLLHFTHPNEGPKHYLGFTSRDPALRLMEHASGHSGSKFTAKLVREGYTPSLAHVYPEGDRTLEYRLKTLSRANKYYQFKNWCPVCGTRHAPEPELIMEKGRGRRRAP